MPQRQPATVASYLRLAATQRGRVSSRDFTRSGRPYGDEPGQRERYDRFLRQGRDQSNSSDDPYGIYRPARGSGQNRTGRAGATTVRAGGPVPGRRVPGRATPPGRPMLPGEPMPPGEPPQPGGPGGPTQPGGPGGPMPPGPRHGRAGGGGFLSRLLRGPWTLKKIAATAGIVSGIGIAALSGLVALAYSKTPIPTAVSQAALQQSSVVYFNNGKTMIGTFGSTDRQLLSYNQMPTVLRNAVLAAEDRQFYTEGGVSVTGTFRAVFNDLTGGSIQGGSTITQQFVRNYYANIGTQQTVSRKLKEIFVAMKLARQESKDWILTQYLNTIYLGNGAYGVGAASRQYFGVPASRLTVAQAAVLAALIQSPSYYPTPAGRQALIARWHYVTSGMVAMRTLSQQKADSLKFPKFAASQQLGNGWSGYNGYIMQAVQNELLNTYHFKPSQITGGGLRIVTTFDKAKMDALYRAVRENKKLMRQGGRALPWYAHIGAVLQRPDNGAIVAMYSGPAYNARHCQKIKCQLDMALQNREQVGSSFKPYVLAAARQEGMNVRTSILDGSSPLCVPADYYPMVYSVPVSSSKQSACPDTTRGWYNVANDPGDSGIGGPQSVVYSTAQSLNTAYADLAHRVGLPRVVSMAKSFGVNTATYPNGSSLARMASQHEIGIALGQASVTVAEQASMFNTLAADGEYVSPHVIQQITQGSVVTHAKVVRREVLTRDVASDVNYVLSFDTTQGTATRAAMTDGRPIIGKTGTTNAAKSAFFIGAIPQYSLGIGIFSNNQDNNVNHMSLNGLGGLSGGGYGGVWPAMIWHTFAQEEFAHLPVQNFATPDFGGTKWVLVKPKPKPKPKPGPVKRPPGCNFCKGHGHKTPSCQPGVILPGCPSPSPTPTLASPSPSPTPSPTWPPGQTTADVTDTALSRFIALLIGSG